MPFAKGSSSQHGHYDAATCVVNVRDQPFGILVVSDSAVELLEFNTQRWWPLPPITFQPNDAATITSNTSPSKDVHGFTTPPASPAPNAMERRSFSNISTVSEASQALGNKLTLMGCVLASVGNQVFAIGGYNGNEEEFVGQNDTSSSRSTKVCSFVFGESDWKEEPCLQVGRVYPAALGVISKTGEKELFVFGGRSITSWSQLNSVESYNPETKRWTTLAPLSLPRMAPAAFSLSEKEIAIVGGFTQDHHWTTSIEVYNTETDSWSNSKNLPSMPVAMAFPKVLVLSKTFNDDGDWQVERILVFGSSLLRSAGSSSFMVILSLNLVTREWTKLLAGPTRKRSVMPLVGSAISWHEKTQTIYSIGGLDARRGQAASKQVLRWRIQRFLAHKKEALLLKSLEKDLVGADQEFLSPTRSMRRLSSQRSLRASNSFQSSVKSGKTGGLPVAGLPLTSVEIGETDDASAAGTLSVISQLPLNKSASTRTIGKIPELDKDEQDTVETDVLKQPIEFVDELRASGRYSGSVVKESMGTSKPIPHGKGQFENLKTGDTYEGEWIQGRRHGPGRLKYAQQGDVFEGFFVDDKKQGRGTYQWRDGRQYDGHYKNDIAEDPHGSLTWKNGTVYVGQFRRGYRTGRGTIRFSNGVRYTGQFRNGKYDGFGTCVFENGRIYSGNWRKGKAHGDGKLEEADGTVLHDGQWDNDAPVLEDS